mgnify:CR=1 FL=1
MTPRIVLHEVGPRDGLQVEKAVAPTETKLRWIGALSEAGLDVVQAGSFVHPEKVPQMADTDELFRRLTAPGAERKGHALYSGLVLNEKGLDRALACGVEMVCLGVSASETHSRKNTGMGTAEATERIVATAKKAALAGRKVQVSVQSAFGCGFEGAVPEENVLAIARSYVDAGLLTISLADTAGHACPAQVERLFGRLLELDPGNQAATIGKSNALNSKTVAEAAASGPRAGAVVRSFVPGRTEAKGTEQGGLVGFEDSAGVNVKKGTAAAELPGRIVFEASPPAPKAGERFRVNVVLANEGQQAISLASMTVATILDGKRQSGPVPLSVTTVAPGQRAPVFQSPEQVWKEGTESWTMEIVLRTTKGETYRNTLAWK